MADRNRIDTSKPVKNPLLTAAGLGFPIENFTSNALLVPTTQNVSSILPADVEEDSFLGQNPAPSSYGSLLFKPPSTVLGASQPLKQSVPSSQPEHTYPQSSSLGLESSTLGQQNPVPLFTQSFSAHSTPLTRPTPIYPQDPLSQKFQGLNLQKTPEARQTPSPGSVTETISLRSSPGIPTPLFFTPQGDSSTLSAPTSYSKSDFSVPSLYSPAPSHPVITPAKDTLFSSNLSSQSEFSVPSLYSPAPSHPVITPAKDTLFSSNLSSQSEVSVPSLYPPTIPPPSLPKTIHEPSLPVSNFSETDFAASLSSSPAISKPSPYTNVNDLHPVSNIHSAHNVHPPQSGYDLHLALSATPPLFPLSNSHQTSTPAPSLYPSVPLASGVASNVSTISTSFDSNVATIPTETSASAPPLFSASSLVTAAQPSGALTNSYRLSNLKRPLYTRPPDLAVTTPIMTKMDTVPPSVMPPQPCSTLFTPEQPVCQDYSIPSPEGPATLPLGYQSATEAQSILPPSFSSLAQGIIYRPVYHHWFYRKDIEGKVLWHPFSMTDSLALEAEFISPNISPETKVSTDGGRYDVEILRRRRVAVYWEEDSREVRRCSWFVKSSIDARYVPYEENLATKLEEEYRQASSTNEWNKHVNLPDGEAIVFHSPNAIAHHSRSPSPDAWGNTTQLQQKPRIVKRGMDEFDISEGEPEKVDHLLFLVHGIGKFCDLKFRPVAEVVDDFRSICLQLLQSHFKGSVEAGTVSRIEVLPVPWHKALHNEEINLKLNSITLQSIPRLRQFTNDTLSDILFYTSPVFCEKIVQTVGNEMNRLYTLYRSRNPDFKGGVSVGGHSLGSVILFDMLCNQKPLPSPIPEAESPSNSEDNMQEEEIKDGLGCFKTKKARLSRGVSYVTIGRAGTGQPYIVYPQLQFNPSAFFALGSPIGMFLTVRGIDLVGEEFQLPTCPAFFNIFHPFDPVAYRIESLIKSELSKYPPVQIPHHKGRKRMHLELKDTLEHVGAVLKQKLMESMRNTWSTVYQFATFHKSDAIEQEVNKVIEDQLRSPLAENQSETVEPELDAEVVIGCLNGGRRVDFVLQEAPLESFNEYIFALTSHACYWESEDTLLMMLKEIYSGIGIMPDNQVLHQILPFEAVERPLTESPALIPPHYVPLSNSSNPCGMDPTAPVSENVNIGPPPISGFVRK